MSESAISNPGGSGKYDRYPGPRSFIDNEVDQRLFFGREQEIDHLLHRIRAIRLLVLFGKSGLGKTSLLQAGLYPRLRERGLLPIPVRLNQPNIEPVQAVFQALRATCRAHGVEYEPRETEGLWEFFKATDLWSGDVLQTPVLVFDQFEEIFTLQSGSVRMTLASQLGELAARGLPTRIRQGLRAGERHNDTPPDVKIILSLREEYVGALEDLVPNVPGIFEQRFRLAPLNRELARRAVIEPAAMDDAAIFNTRPFRYSDGALDAIMDFLANRQGEVEPFQLQIFCRHAEQQIALRSQGGDRDGQIDESVLGGRKAMEKLLEHFYRSAILVLASWRQRSRARNLCELGLLSPSGHRVSVEQGQIHKQYKVSDRSLNTLTQARLVRKESRPGLEGFYYELSHDRVASAVNRSRRFRVPTKFKIAAGLLGMIFLVAAGLYQERVRREIVDVQRPLVYKLIQSGSERASFTCLQLRQLKLKERGSQKAKLIGDTNLEQQIIKQIQDHRMNIDHAFTEYNGILGQLAKVEGQIVVQEFDKYGKFLEKKQSFQQIQIARLMKGHYERHLGGNKSLNIWMMDADCEALPGKW